MVACNVQALEKFSGAASEVATRLRQLCVRLEETQFPNDVTQTELLIAEHDRARSELKLDLESVIAQGESLLDCFTTAGCVRQQPQPRHHDDRDRCHGDRKAVALTTPPLPVSRATQVMAVERFYAFPSCTNK